MEGDSMDYEGQALESSRGPDVPHQMYSAIV